MEFVELEVVELDVDGFSLVILVVDMGGVGVNIGGVGVMQCDGDVMFIVCIDFKYLF